VDIHRALMVTHSEYRLSTVRNGHSSVVVANGEMIACRCHLRRLQNIWQITYKKIDLMYSTSSKEGLRKSRTHTHVHDQPRAVMPCNSDRLSEYVQRFTERGRKTG
jgi:hypothetical protein